MRRHGFHHNQCPNRYLSIGFGHASRFLDELMGQFIELLRSQLHTHLSHPNSNQWFLRDCAVLLHHSSTHIDQHLQGHGQGAALHLSKLLLNNANSQDHS